MARRILIIIACFAGLLAVCVGTFMTVPVTRASIAVGMTEAYLLYTVDQATRDSFKLPTLAEEMG